jgi:hypothetical protein
VGKLMGIVIFSIITFLETFFLFLITIKTKSASSESIILGFSVERITLIIFQFLFIIFTVILLNQSIRFAKGKKSPILSILNNEGWLWKIIGFSFLSASFLLSLFIIEKDQFGDLFQLFLALEPTLLLFYLISIQTLVFTLFWYCQTFTKTSSSADFLANKRDINFLLAFFAILLLVKVFFILPHGHGLLRDIGESNYFKTMQDLKGRIFLYSAYEQTTHQPFLYALSLMPTLFIQKYSFDLIKLINSIFTTSVIFPVYLIASQILNRKSTFAVVIITSILPFQFLLPIRLLSENLYLPLFFWAVYMVYCSPNDPKYKLQWDILTGVILGLLYLTRFITLALIPFFLLAWWGKPLGSVKRFSELNFKKIIHFGVICLVILLTFSPWIAINLKNGFDIGHALGFGIAQNTNFSQLTMGNLIKWAILYLGYFVLLTAPFLNLLFLLNKNQEYPESAKRWFFLAFLLTFSFLAAVTRHSWRAWYNEPFPMQIMGRYVIYLTPIFLITAFHSFRNAGRVKKYSKIKFLLRGILYPLGLIFLSYKLVIQGIFFKVGESFIDAAISLDGFYLKLMGGYFFLLIMFLYISHILLNRKNNSKALEFTSFFIILFYLVGLPPYLKAYENQQFFQKMGEEIAVLLPDCVGEQQIDFNCVIYLPTEFTRNQRNDIWWSLEIRNLEHEYSFFRYEQDKLSEIFELKGIVVIPDNIDFADTSGRTDLLEDEINYSIEIVGDPVLHNF